MGIFDSLKKATQTFFEDLNTPESFKKGQKFEDFTREVIFSIDRYKLIKKTHDYKQNSSDYVQDSLEPDFKFECIDTKKQFYVEAKFRSWFYQGKIEFCKDGQYKRLSEINKKEPVFILIGIDGEPDDPTYVCLIPMSDIKSTSLTEQFLENYDIAHNLSIPSKKLWSLINQNTVIVPKEDKTNIKPISANKNAGYCIRCNKSIALNPRVPYCKDCYNVWKKYKDEKYQENHCHVCGKKETSTLKKPACPSCYKTNKNNLEFPE